ncbi:PQQ-binding-like beta-propeller repeat protein [Microbulbifer sp. ANSA003]|uniref:outer membrane protein assembly factor BamB family protein n=1 Tax=Microbulbifer sp. ANSA003 TaxID=3243360 RepID=UPI0040426574
MGFSLLYPSGFRFGLGVTTILCILTSKSILAALPPSMQFESPVDKSLVVNRFPDFSIKLENTQGLSDLRLRIGRNGLPESNCLIDEDLSMAFCSLAISLSDGWQSIQVWLFDGSDLLDEIEISIAVDEDNDKIPNHEDKCSGTLDPLAADLDGCSPIQLDSDGDGISNVDEFLQILPAINMLLASSDQMPEVPEPIENAIEDGLFFESPVHKSLVSTDKPSLRLRASSGPDLDGALLTVSVASNDAACSFDTTTGVGKCELAHSIGDYWVDVEASLFKSDVLISRSVISIAADFDEDGIANFEDHCSFTKLQEQANSLGCGPSQIDSDFDGIYDLEEIAVGSDPFDMNSYPAINIDFFTALPEQVSRAGDSVGLSWSVTGATSISLSNDANDLSFSQLSNEGTARVAPQFATTYMISAKGPSGSASKEVEVSVSISVPENQWDESPIDQVEDAISASLTVTENGTVFLGAFDNNYYRFTPSGDLDWTLENLGIVMNKAATFGGSIYVGTNNASGGSVVALGADKTTKWKNEMADGVIAGPVLNDDGSVLYVVTYNGSVFGLDTNSGDEVWSYQLPESETISATPALSEDGSILFVHGNTHNVYALKVGTTSSMMSQNSQMMLNSDSAGDNQMQIDGPLIWQSDIGLDDE